MYSKGWGCSSVIQHLPNMREDLGFIPSTVKMLIFEIFLICSVCEVTWESLWAGENWMDFRVEDMMV
jgi:hypothetical protein